MMRPSILCWASLRPVAGIFLCVLLVLGAVSISEAQSGRRPPKRPESPDPLPPKQEEPPIKPSTDQEKTQIPVKVIWSNRNIGTSTIYTRIVEDGCLERLSQARSVKTSTAADLNRKEAIDIAKGSKDIFVLYFELEADVAAAQSVGINSVPPQYLYARYEVFTPGTGKTKTSGRVFQQQRGPGGIPVPLPRTNTSAEYSLRYVGREMADRLLDTLGVARPSERH
ncbi:MAG: hypothetical protein WAV20_17325 [Blastocatellia bacterium]